VGIKPESMTPDEYIAKCKSIHARLAEIATRTGQMARAHSAHDKNPEYVNIVIEQDALLRKLTDFDRLVTVT
jgi:hypothetical protein